MQASDAQIYISSLLSLPLSILERYVYISSWMFYRLLKFIISQTGDVICTLNLLPNCQSQEMHQLPERTGEASLFLFSSLPSSEIQSKPNSIGSNS